MTLVATAVTSFGLAAVSAWIAYERWIAPILRAMAHKIQSANSDGGWEDKLSEATQIPPPQRRSRSGSFPDLSILSDTSPTHPIVQTTQTSGPWHTISSLTRRIQSSFTTPTITIQKIHDLENTPVRPGAQGGRRNRLRAAARMITGVRLAAKRLLSGTPGSVHQALTPSPLETSESFMSPISALPFGLELRVNLEHNLGEVHDLMFSPNGLFLAITGWAYSYKSSVVLC